jgi:tetratricopeptide (TPR) repeat protein
MRFKQRYILSLIGAALVMATLVAYEPIRHNDFVKYDDDIYISENSHIKEGITRDSVLWAFTKPYTANWHPLTWLSHMLDCEIYGLNPLGHHVTSVLIHIANSVLLFWVLRKMTGIICHTNGGQVWPSAFAAAVFALHPVHVESVAWAAERKDVLSGLFWMLTILAYFHYVRQPNVRRYVFALLFFAMGLMAKPMLVTLPFVLLLLDWWPLGRNSNGSTLLTTGIKNQKSKIRSYTNLILEKIPFFVLSALSCVMTLVAQHRGKAVATLEQIPLNYRIVNTFISYISYIGKTLWPSQLAVLYPYHCGALPKATVAVCASLFILLSALSILIGRRRKYAAVGWLWFIGTLVPVIGLVQVGSQTMADRYMYIPMVGLLIIIGWVVKDLVDKLPGLRTAAAVLATVILSSLLMLTRMQVRHWQNSFTLFEHTLKVTKNNAIIENNYGRVLLDAERLDEARQHLSNALRIKPRYADALNNIGKVFLNQGKFNEAVACFKEAIVCSNKTPSTSTDQFRIELYVNLATAYSQLGNYELAIQNCNKAIELKPDSSDALNNLAWLLVTIGDVSIENVNRAIEYAERACKLTEYKDPALLDTLAVAYAGAGRFNDAIATAEQALKAAKADSKEKLADEIQNRLKLYQAGRSYRQK